MSGKKPIEMGRHGWLREYRRRLKRVVGKYNLCPHEAEKRAYSSEAEIKADPVPTEVCTKCGCHKLIAALIYQDGIPEQLPPGVKRGGR